MSPKGHYGRYDQNTLLNGFSPEQSCVQSSGAPARLLDYCETLSHALFVGLVGLVRRPLADLVFAAEKNLQRHIIYITNDFATLGF